MQNIELEILQTICELDLPNAMSDKQLTEYNEELNFFIDTLSGKSYELVKFFVEMEYEVLYEKLYNLAVELKKILAINAVGKCYQLIDAVVEENKDEIDILLGRFIAELNTLSIDIQLAQYQSKEKRKAQLRQATQVRKIILAVDDAPVILNALKGVIDGEKYRFIGLATGNAALRYLSAHTPPDLIILDIEMPVMNGYELAKSIVAKGFDMPIMFLTNHATRETVIKALKVGATDFLVKPINEKLILDKLERYLG